MKKVTLPASSYDAASIVHTKSENHKGIVMSYFSEGEFLYGKSDAASIIILFMMLRALFIQNRKITKESLCHTFRKASFCMEKVTLPASSYDAASIVHTKSGYDKGIGMSYFLEDEFLYEKSVPRASGGDARCVRSCAQTKKKKKIYNLSTIPSSSL
jgi:hypothetical protein